MKSWLAIITVMTAWGANGSVKASMERAKVVVYLNANLFEAAAKLGAARNQAKELFKTTGIDLQWRYGHPRGDATAARVLSIEFVAEAPISFRNRQHERAMAVAYRYVNGSTSIIVFTDRVTEFLTGFDGPTAGKLLGHILAHEIAHVLEGGAQHSATGLMQAFWSLRDYDAIRRNHLPFAQNDVDLMQAGLSASARH